ncbi:MAG: DNA internalization-related competence protein ComEC/Rec2 [Oceanospirillales bacterium]|nr:DNA internalization-related competence protein ComEC/Rec2 [Oceanospirillales bacterium]
MIAFISGLLAVAWLPDLSYTPVLFLAAMLAVIRRARVITAHFLFGVLLAALWGGWQLYHRLPDALVRVDVGITGIIDQLPVAKTRSQRFTLRVVEVDSDDPRLQRLRRIHLSYYDAHQLLKAGDRLKAVVRLFPPRGLSNPSSFDAERRYLSESIDARGYIRQLVARQASGLSVAAIRQYIADAIDRCFTPDVAPTLRAITLGDRSALTPDQWRLLSETGTAHLLVVSGLHVAVMAGVGLLLGRVLLVLPMLAGFNVRYARHVGLVLSLLLCVAYAGVAGMGLPVQRALIMVIAFIAGEWWLHPFGAWKRWRLALALVLLMQPLAVIEAGAWLSFAAVAILIWLVQVGGEWRHRVAQWWRMQGQLFVGMLPITAVLFHQVGFLAPMVNFIALPSVSVLVMALPFLLPAALSGVQWSAELIEWGVQLFWAVIASMRQDLGLYLALPEVGIGATVLALIAVVWWLLPFPLKWRWLSLCMMAPLLASQTQLPSQGNFTATVFDVGQGLAVLVETGDGRVIYDLGPGYFGGGAAFYSAIAPSLRARNLEGVEQLVVSHDDLDHSGGLSAYVSAYDYEALVVGQPLKERMSAENCAEKGDLLMGGVRFRYMQASKSARVNDNGQSCVVVVEGRNCVLLIPGDLEEIGERDLVARAQLPKVDWLIAGHHGSKTSTSGLWLEALKPGTVIFSRGMFNRFGHPAPEVVDRVRHAGAQVLDTATDGAVIIHAEESCRSDAWREVKKRYWTAG